MKNFLATPCVILLIIGFAFFSACQDEYLEPEENQGNENLVLKKGGKQTEVDQADLYGDLWVMERDNSGVPILYDLNYRADYQDNWVYGIIDVVNPKLDTSFYLDVLVRDENGYVTYEPLTNPDDDLVPITDNRLIEPVDGYVVGADNVIALYDAEGEVLPTVALHVVPIEMGRLNIIRSPSTVISKRLTEVIKNFGDGTVANVTRDFCGRIMMLRTEDALVDDKPIDSPLENLAIYKELLLHGFDGGADENGLKFLIGEDNGYGGYDMQFRVDKEWTGGAKSYPEISEPDQLIMNLAAACISAGSDKTNTLIIDEIVFVNLFMGIPEVTGANVTCFLPTVKQEIRMMDKTDKHNYSLYRYYVDYSGFEYDRTKFQETLVDYVTLVGDYVDGVLVGSHTETLAEDLELHEILMGNAPLTVEANAIYRYTDKEGQSTSGALGFACQADDYVQALEVIHNNEEFLVWEMATPTWNKDFDIPRGEFAPFNFVPEEESHSRRPSGKGDDSTTDDSTSEGGDDHVDDGGSSGGGSTGGGSSGKGRRR
ncbi:hypothetical protein [Labilibaculum antarcticum]|uniref:Uncharacterized protein n=1 Tax=Labilibaculum antarcticum TaxID=1717717 RepID=A0A1Y1CQS0_9BACT|nr:hypothetical protein [Labilibaculum antarcticum]BAX82604.1 hypothetical protein ALGA_4314 [Labilibaculum antarcticum]